MREETFGPVVGIMKVRDDDEAIELMNDSPYGLTASIWTTDLDRAAKDRRPRRDRHGLHEPLRLSRPGAGLDRRQGYRPRRARCQTVSAYDALTRPKSYHLREVMMTTDFVANWSYPTAIRFGAGRISELAGRLQGCRHHAAAARHRCRPRQARHHASRRSTSCEQAGSTPRHLLRCAAEPGRDRISRAASSVFKAGEP